MVKTVCYVVSQEHGDWHVQHDHEGSTSLFATFESAVAAARSAARLHAQMTGVITCVQIEEDYGAIVDDSSYAGE